MNEQRSDTAFFALRLIDKACQRFLNGALPTPAHDDALVRALTAVAIPEEGSPDLRGCEREAVRNNFETHLHEAIATLRTAQGSGYVN
jgi:hypothetical protein